jgi:hypothetical protein
MLSELDWLLSIRSYRSAIQMILHTLSSQARYLLHAVYSCDVRPLAPGNCLVSTSPQGIVHELLLHRSKDPRSIRLYPRCRYAHLLQITSMNIIAQAIRNSDVASYCVDPLNIFHVISISISNLLINRVSSDMRPQKARFQPFLISLIRYRSFRIEWTNPKRIIPPRLGQIDSIDRLR